MIIKYAGPVRGGRELMCKTDEAQVSRIRGSSARYEGMVERLQTNATVGRDHSFAIKGTNGDYHGNPRSYEYRVSAESCIYHFGRFLALRAARALFPDNIVDVRELRMRRENGVLYSATYSDFVSDDNGVIKRRADTMREFYARTFASEDARRRFVAAADRAERRLNPDLEPLSSRIKEAGIGLSHPEQNYHLSDGTTVFFEIDDIDPKKVATAALEAGAKQAIKAVANMYALTVKHIAVLEMFKDNSNRLFRNVADTALPYTYGYVLEILSNPELDKYDWIAHPMEFITGDVVAIMRNLGVPPARPLVGLGIDRILYDECYEIAKKDKP